MRLPARAALIAALASSLLLASAPSFAQSEADKGQARELGEAGFKALDAGEWAKAEDLFRRADQLYHAPTLEVGLARAQAHLGKYVESWENYHRVIVEGVPAGAPPAMVKAVSDARAEIDAVAARRSKVTIQVTGPTAPSVTIDGVAVPPAGLGLERPVDPGTHVVKASADGYKPAETSFTVAEGAAATASIAMEKDTSVAVSTGTPTTGTPATTGTGQPATPGAEPGTAHGGSMQRTLGWVALGVGAAGLVTGTIAGLLVLNKHSDLASNVCPTGTCDFSHQSDVDSYHTMGTISTVGFIVGGVAAAGGAVLLFTAPKRESGTATGASVTPYVGLGSVGATGTF